MSPPDFREAHRGWHKAFLSVADFGLYVLEKFLESGRSAVMLFFVLSGFVLAYSLQKQPISYLSYAVKRGFRIYPAFAVAILCSYLLHWHFGIQTGAENPPVRYTLSSFNLSLTTLLKHLAMFGNQPNNELDIPVWSIVQEMRISLLFPLILFLVGSYRWFSIAIFLLLSVGCTFCTLEMTGKVANGIEDVKVLPTFLSTGYFIVFFACGAFLAIEREKITSAMALLRPSYKLFLFTFCAYAFLKRDLDSHSITGALVDHLRGVGSLVLVSLALGVRRFQTALNHSSFTWLGRISYSLYLVHIPVIYGVYAFNEKVSAATPVLVLTAVILLLSLGAAEIMNRTIEKPFIRFGKNIVSPLRAF